MRKKQQKITVEKNSVLVLDFKRPLRSFTSGPYGEQVYIDVVHILEEDARLLVAQIQEALNCG